MSDLISRQTAIRIAEQGQIQGFEWQIRKLLGMPSAEPEPKPISYMECANAMLKMWIDNVLIDGEYNRIMEKLNSKHMADMRGEQDE